MRPRFIALPARDSALSDSAAAKTMARVQKKVAAARSVVVKHRYLVCFHESPDFIGVEECERLLNLLESDGVKPTELATCLSAGKDSFHPPGASDTPPRYYIAPRPGTISPWSSRATDIARNCGLTFIRRIERARGLDIESDTPLSREDAARAMTYLYDRMTEAVYETKEELGRLFERRPPRPLQKINITTHGRAALEEANVDMGLALAADEIDYLLARYSDLRRDPTDAELMMFAQANSEHCRHKIFNAAWAVNGEPQTRTLFDMIRHTHQKNPRGVLSAYRDNAAVIHGCAGDSFAPAAAGEYKYQTNDTAITIKVETHNHPTAIAPAPGAATGVGGELRDHGATGRGARPKAGLCGFCVSDLHLPDLPQPWEEGGQEDHAEPPHIASALDIMLEGPIGAATYNNEFGRPALAGFFRAFESRPTAGGVAYGYHKPIMLAGGVGCIAAAQTQKAAVAPGDKIIVLGGPAMLIGLGGGAASSLVAGAATAELDFASVQRDNAEMERRCQEVINGCVALGDDNPILSIHDVGAGGLANAVPELADNAGVGAWIDLRRVPNADSAMSPMQIWCNEAQERYVLAVNAADLKTFESICDRERCPQAVIGAATDTQDIVVTDGDDEDATDAPVNLPLDLLFGTSPQTAMTGKRETPPPRPFDTVKVDIKQAAKRVLQSPTVADKTFLITIGDRTVGGLAARDQMAGPWQTPVADAAVTLNDYRGYHGEAMAAGERPSVAVLDAAASARLAVAEAITNIAAADIDHLADIKLSANWMAACGAAADNAMLYDAVSAVGIELCPALNLSIPVGKDSLSMRTVWRAGNGQREVKSPLSVVVAAFAPVHDARRTLTPWLRTDLNDTALLLIDLSAGKNRLGGSIFAQVFNETGGAPADLDEPRTLAAFFASIRALARDSKILAYHDRSDGGLFACLCEMAFAGRCGLDIDITPVGADPAAALFTEEPGAVVQVRAAAVDMVLAILRKNNLAACLIGRPLDRSLDRPSGRVITINHNGKTVFAAPRAELQSAWSATSYHMRRLRDGPECARQEYERIKDEADRGLVARPTFPINENPAAPYINRGARPRLAVLREQGVNGHVEMAAAFDRAGFAAVDVHMSDILKGRASLAGFKGLAACGGFSYGDVLGAGQGWAKSILFNARARDEFAAFFARTDNFALGVCNGCQMMAAIKEIIPGAADWPRFARNNSGRFESRLTLVGVRDTAAIVTKGMAGSVLPIVVAHAEGRAVFKHARQSQTLEQNRQIVLRYVDADNNPATAYPQNPNGSPGGAAGWTTRDGRFTIMMPHPEPLFRAAQHSWRPDDWNEDAPWLRLFTNARAFVG